MISEEISQFPTHLQDQQIQEPLESQFPIGWEQTTYGLLSKLWSLRVHTISSRLWIMAKLHGSLCILSSSYRYVDSVGESFGILEDDFYTVRHAWKLEQLQQIMPILSNWGFLEVLHSLLPQLFADDKNKHQSFSAILETLIKSNLE